MSGFYLEGDVDAIRHQATRYGDAATRSEQVSKSIAAIGARVQADAGDNEGTKALKKALERDTGLLNTAKDKYHEAETILNRLADELADMKPHAYAAYSAPCKEPGIFDFLVHNKNYYDYQADARSSVDRAAKKIAELAASPEYMHRGPTFLDSVGTYLQAFGEEAVHVGGDIIDSVADTVAGLYNTGKYVLYDANPLTVLFRPQELIETYAQTAANVTNIYQAATSDPGKFWNGVWEATYNKELLDKDPAAWYAVSVATVLTAVVGGGIPTAVKVADRSAVAATKVGDLLHNASDAVKKFLTSTPEKMGATGQRLSQDLSGVDVLSVRPGSTELKVFDQYTSSDRWGANNSIRGYGGENAFSELYQKIVPSYRPAISNQEGIDGLTNINGQLTVSQVKTIDPAASTYQTPSQFYGTLKGYMDKLNSYDGGPFKDVNGQTQYINPKSIGEKQLVIGLPDSGLGDEQVAKLQELTALTKTEQYNNIRIMIVEIPR